MAAIPLKFSKDHKEIKIYKSIMVFKKEVNSQPQFNTVHYESMISSDKETTLGCLTNYIDQRETWRKVFANFAFITASVNLRLNSPCVNEGKEVIIQNPEEAKALLTKLNKLAFQP